VLPSALPLIRGGQLRALAVTGTTRADTLPDTPTMIEAGVPGYAGSRGNGILAPARTPKPIVDKLTQHSIGRSGSRPCAQRLPRWVGPVAPRRRTVRHLSTIGFGVRAGAKMPFHVIAT